MRFFLFLLFIGGASLLSAPAQAQTITITQVQAMDFATLEIPSSGSRFITVSPDAGSTGTGTVLIGVPLRAQFKLRRTGGSGAGSISINASPTSGTGPVTLSNLTGRYVNVSIPTFPQGGLQMPNTSGRDLFIGGTLTYTNAVTEITYSLSYNVDVVIE